MTREEILAMEPGAMLDGVVATKVMGWEETNSREDVYDFEGRYEGFSQWKDDEDDPAILPDYSTDKFAAREVEKRVLQLEKWEKYVDEIKLMMKHHPEAENRKFFMVHASPENRCKAALLAVLGGEEE